nr:PREDICTED: rho GTPase-activating protein 12-like [Bemisia tabaci]
MELQDITLRVLYDFKYATKDGKKVEIKEGEKLYLIKKTNEDWWQVIRSSGKPFYVPASYVKEVRRINNENAKPEILSNSNPTFVNDSNDTKSLECNPTPHTNDFRERSHSVDHVPESKEKRPVPTKRTIFDKPIPPYENIPIDEVAKTRIIDGHITTESVQKSSFFRAATLDEEADYVNLRKEGDGFVIDDSPVSTLNSLNSSRGSIGNQSTQSDKIPGTNGYSHVSLNKQDSPVNVTPIKLTNSLEELNNEIKLKAEIISSNKSLNLPIKESSREELNNHDSKNNLHYSGSFKTKHERAKWGKQQLLPPAREEKSDEQDSEPPSPEVEQPAPEKESSNMETPECDPKKKDSEPIFKPSETEAIKNKEPLIIEGDRKSISALKNNFEAKSEDSGKLTGRKSFDGHAEPPRKISESNHVKQIVEIFSNKDRNTSRESIHNDSTELKENSSVSVSSVVQELDRRSSTMDVSRLSTSDKGSTESLLDVDYSLNRRKASVGTTASESILQTDDNFSESGDDLIMDSSRKSSSKVTGDRKKRRSSLKRNRRVESCRLRFPLSSISPPTVLAEQEPVRELLGGWAEYLTADGRTFYHNSRSGESSWKPPRRRYNTDNEDSRDGSSGNIYSGSSSPLAEVDESPTTSSVELLSVPTGWSAHIDKDTGLPCYVNAVTGARWFSSNDYEGRVYFFEENSNESSWTLPENPDPSNANESTGNEKESTQDQSPAHEPPVKSGKVDGAPEEKNLSRSIKSRSMILLDSKLEELTPMSRNWPQLWNGHMCILQEGSLNRTKITENGKRLRKNWASAYVVLTELFLLFFKDAKSFAAMKNGGWKPELCVDLNGALIDRGDKVSSRKNVFIISTVLGLQVLIQCDCTATASSWLNAIQSAIKNLPSGFDNCSRLIRNSTSPECNSPEGGKKAKIGRSKSVKLKNKDGSIEDLTISVAERQTKIRARLKKFFHRRPTMESLVKKGIWKDEPVFGCFLEQVCSGESPRVPLVVQRCIKCIESSEENMKADGLYRASGNLSQVQKIRLQVDQNNLAVLDQEEDVHVLTGALKLFFRELKEPLIPCHLFNKALKASTSHSRKEKLNCFREITKALPTANHDTLKFLLQHLLRVTKYKEFNRMHIPNLAIVFGPTLMWPAQESANMALDLMQQNLVIECFLVEFEQIFR